MRHIADEPEAVDALATALAAARSVLFFTGAGISTPSGIPDYRGPAGVWNTRRPVFYQDFMASEEARVMYWRQKAEDRLEFGAAEPNPAHIAVAELERMSKVNMVVTQNIDGLHREAGTTPERLIEIHGTVAEVECQSCGRRDDPAPHFAFFAEHGSCPTCSCGGPMKSATISFGQSLRSTDLGRAMEAAESCDTVIALGSSLVVYPAADIPLRAAARHVPYVIVNQGETDHDQNPAVSLRIEADVSVVLPAAVAAIR